MQIVGWQEGKGGAGTSVGALGQSPIHMGQTSAPLVEDTSDISFSTRDGGEPSTSSEKMDYTVTSLLRREKGKTISLPLYESIFSRRAQFQTPNKTHTSQSAVHRLKHYRMQPIHVRLM